MVLARCELGAGLGAAGGTGWQGDYTTRCEFWPSILQRKDGQGGARSAELLFSAERAPGAEDRSPQTSPQKAFACLQG